MTVDTLPVPGIGTFRLKGDEARNTVKLALEAGYRHIDTAQAYSNEQAVGEAVKESGVPREDLFLTTKVWIDRFRPDDLKASVTESLQKLGTGYADLVLIHWPSPEDELPMADYLGALKDVQAAGQTRCIGVSNFTNAHLDKAVEILGKEAILTNQVEVHPFLQNDRVVEHCQEKGITVTGYMPLAVGKVMEDDVLGRIAEKHQATPAQIALAWVHSRNIVPIPSSTKKEHIQSNLEAMNITLDRDDLEAIRGLDRDERIANPGFAPNWD
jgi:2,5-diketo-D-gluconate reductase B